MAVARVQIIEQVSPLADWACKIYPLIFYGTAGSGLFSLTLVTLNRACMLFLPLYVSEQS